MAAGQGTLPRGRYLAGEAGQLAGVSGTTIGQWARWGYIRASRSDRVPHVYSFGDVAEAMVVHELLERGVSHRDIRTAIGLLGEYGDWPLAEAPLATVATARGARLRLRRGDVAYDVGEGVWQQVLDPERLDELRRQLGDGGWAARTLGDLRHVEVHPERHGGRPVVRGRRIPAQEVAEVAALPGGVEDLVFAYGLRASEIADARRWWTEVRRLSA